MSGCSSPTNNDSSLSFLAPYMIPPVASSLAILPAFHDLVAKSALQKGETIPLRNFRNSFAGALKASPTVGAIVGTQMIFQKFIEKQLISNNESPTLQSSVVSSLFVGMASAPILAVFNGQTMGWSVKESLRKFSLKQSFAISLQETAFVASLSVVDHVTDKVKKQYANLKGVEYAVAFCTGALGSLAGHPANTALTRWQNGMKIENITQLMAGGVRKARAIGIFSFFYKMTKESLSSLSTT
jgi:hypothetical protein